jgi:class 3 adenylate cyclase
MSSRSDSSDSIEDVTHMSKEGSTSNGTSTAEPSRAIPKDQLAENETRAVFKLRVLVLLALLLAAIAVSLVVYFITSNSEEDEFQGQYEGHATKVLESFEDIIELKMEALAALGVGLTSYARGQNGTSWPFVTMNDFQQRAASARSLSNALFLQVLPIVSDENRNAWEEYSLQNTGWLAEGRAYQERFGLGNRRLQTNTPGKELDFSTGIANRIYVADETGSKIVDPGPGPFYPNWVASPVIDLGLVNYNTASYGIYGPFIEKCAVTGELVIGGIDTAVPGDTSSEDRTTSFFSSILSFAAGQSVNYNGDPMSSVYLPVFESYEGDRTPVAVIGALINWGSYFHNILPSNAEGVVVVLENSCDGPFTYEINGRDVDYLGRGDLHNRKFDRLQRSATLGELLRTQDNTELGLKFNQDICVYTLHVYPSEELYDHYNTSMPIIITFAVGMIFVFTALMFCVYDRLVERRQNLVMRTAEQTTAIVSSLFPDNVRDRLMQENSTRTRMSPNHRLKSFLNDGDNGMELGAKPIADLFPHTTVLFADIVGFTAWSSAREPGHVFELLQTIYQAFDALAKKHRVFKVETIGDSYVAVTGLPNPQEKHAILMARFAWDCMTKMNEVAKRLEVKLGPDTADLTMRFGMHSGPVTAGVLRGEKSRFQLFGDTVNTAARMER